MADKTAFDYVNEIWSIANYVRDVIRPADYNKLILPFAVLRRFECALEPTRAAVSRQAAKGVWDDDDPKYCALSGHCFYNVTSFTLSNLGASKTCDALMAYISGFSANAREVLQRFEMRQTCEKLDEKGMLYEVCTRFAGFDLGPKAVSDRMMTDIYEHLIQRYGEEISQDAEDFMTPKDVARLATALLFANEDTLLNADDGDIRTLYDGSCGTCGFICDALDQLDEWHDRGHFKSPTKIVPYGQELEDATWAMGKAALMLRNIAGGSGDVLDQMTDLSAGIMLGDTLDDDKFEDRAFNYQLTNPPYGKEWKKEKDAVLEEMGRGFGGRFGAGKPDIDDGSMLFMQNVAAKMAPPEEGGGKAAIVLSGSPLFNGDAGSGPSGIRRWLFSEDLGRLHREAADRDLLPHGHRNLHLGAQQPQAGEPQGVRAAHRRLGGEDRPAQEPGEQALRGRRGPGRVDRAHLRRRARPRQVGHRPGRGLHVPQGDHAAPAARCH